MNWEKVAFGLAEEGTKLIHDAFAERESRGTEAVAAALSANYVLIALSKAILFGAEDASGS
jgi:hypothetical protein